MHNFDCQHLWIAQTVARPKIGPEELLALRLPNGPQQAVRLRTGGNVELPGKHALVLTAPAMTVLVGGLRALGAQRRDSRDGVWTEKSGKFGDDYFLPSAGASPRKRARVLPSG